MASRRTGRGEEGEVGEGDGGKSFRGLSSPSLRAVAGCGDFGVCLRTTFSLYSRPSFSYALSVSAGCCSAPDAACLALGEGRRVS